MRLQVEIGGGMHETLSTRDAGRLKREGLIAGGEGGMYTIADGIGGWQGVCTALAKWREREGAN